MEISAVVDNGRGVHHATVSTAGAAQSIDIRAKASGQGSAVNGGELLMLALATCYCNDLYREAAQLGISLERVEVEARADFDGVGVAGKNIRYRVRVDSPAAATQIETLLERTDAVAEVQNTLRAGAVVARRAWND